MLDFVAGATGDSGSPGVQSWDDILRNGAQTWISAAINQKFRATDPTLYTLGPNNSIVPVGDLAGGQFLVGNDQYTGFSASSLVVLLLLGAAAVGAFLLLKE
jgi:hypothetical protein